MLSTVIIADDLTGANASGVLFLDLQMKVMTALHDEISSNFIKNFSDIDVIAISTNSRADNLDLAYKKVFNAGKFFKKYEKSNEIIFNKRIDSTLRGNIGTEIDAIIDALGKDRIVFMVPAFPKSKRQCHKGYMIVDGVYLQNTSVANDPKTPVTMSRVKDIIKLQSKNKIAEIHLDTIIKSTKEILLEVDKQVESGAKIIVFDALSDDDIDKIASTIYNYKKKYITVCPGPFIKAICNYKLLEKITKKDKILLVIGSVTDLTKQQIHYLMSKEEVSYFYLSALELLDNYDDLYYLETMSEYIIKEISHNIICITTTNVDDNYKIDLDVEAKFRNIDIEEASQRINKALSSISEKIISHDKDIVGLVTSGGDTTKAVTNSLDCDALKLESEIIPLVVHGKLYKNKKKFLDIVTKGGLIGKRDGLYKCVKHLQK
ncbi:four-carbon acid sugar kinase family protein [Oceanivirga salmonicida]|uniref:four-carbon acid sugar kinase family protein n=1 Tax=Oceanivirga salmonicida TaxID=1769291 RepID=UPI000833157E|nr:four-carbon acid sugar kinase family protein [Oceanivirga salmonicida]